MAIQSTCDWDHASLVMSMDSLSVIGSFEFKQKTMQRARGENALKAHNNLI